MNAYSSYKEDLKVPAGWTGSVASCLVGSESQASLDATLRTINSLRTMAGVLPVTLNPEMNRRAQAAALIMQAAGELSHYPGTSSPCYSEEGAEGASTSNLYGGRSGPEAMVGYVEDQGVESLGHRLWLLNPYAMEFGTGSTGSYNALTVVGAGGDGSRESSLPVKTWNAWPPDGAVPWPWVFEDWSVTVAKVPDEIYGDPYDPDFVYIDPYEILRDATVTVSANGKPLVVSPVRDFITGSGPGVTISWKVGIPDYLRRADQSFQVKVTTPGGIDGMSYTVEPFSVPGDPAYPQKRIPSSLTLTRVKQSNTTQTLRLGFSRSLEGRSANVVIRSVQMSCGTTRRCTVKTKRVLQRSSVDLTGKPLVRVRKPTRRWSKTVIEVSIKGWQAPRGYVRGASVTRELLGPRRSMGSRRSR